MRVGEVAQRLLTRLRVAWSRLRGSLWFVPGVLVAAAIGLAVALVALSAQMDRQVLIRHPRIFGAGAQSSRDMLATIASAMMTVAGVTFSITILAVAQASSQYTPRILRNFMSDRGNQVTLGTLTGVFVYCLVVLRTIRGGEEQLFIPAVAVLTAFVLAIVGIGVLIYFIHHVAASLQASGVLARVRDETLRAIDALFPDDLGEELEGKEVADGPGDGARTILARRTGYVTHVDGESLLAYAVKHDVVIWMERGIGEHVIADTPLLALTGGSPDGDEAAALDDLFGIASYRTVDQDAEFGIRQIVDVAVKALSPGVNDTSTAIAAIDALGAVLVRLACRRVENRERAVDGELRVVARGPTYDGLVSAAWDEIRRNAEGNVSVLARLLAVIGKVARQTPSAERRSTLLAHAHRVRALAERSVPDPDDRAEVEAAYQRVCRYAP